MSIKLKRIMASILIISVFIITAQNYSQALAGVKNQSAVDPTNRALTELIQQDMKAQGIVIDKEIIIAGVDRLNEYGVIDYYLDGDFEGRIAILSKFGGKWIVISSFNPSFNDYLDSLSTELLSEAAKIFFKQGDQLPSLNVTYTGHKLPWEGGISRKVTGTPATHTSAISTWAYDFSMNVGTPLWATTSGTVALIKENSSTGGCNSAYANLANYVVINNDNSNTASLYLHLNTNGATVSVGQHVNQGDLIGYSGQTGYSCGAHLHFQVQDRGSWWLQSHQVIFDPPIGEPGLNSFVVSNNYRTPISGSCANSTSDEVYVCDPDLTPSYNGNTCTSYWYQFAGFDNHPSFLTLNAFASTTSSNSAIWRPTLPSTGNYEIFAFIGQHGNVDRNCGWAADTVSIDTNLAKYTVFGNDSTLLKEVVVNQQAYPNQWVSLGYAQLDAGTSASVRLSDLTGETRLSHNVSFGAMRFKLSTPTCFSLTTQVMPEASGTISQSNYNSGGCPNGYFSPGSQVTITANPAAGYEFLNWSGASTSLASNIIITMNSNTNVTANFDLAEYNKNWISDLVFTGEFDTSVGQIRYFLDQRGSCLALPIYDTDGILIDVPQLIQDAAAANQINPKVLLTTMQKEQSAISVCPSITKLNRLMGIGSVSTARNQISTAASLYRAYINEQNATGYTRSGWAVAVTKETQDGVFIIPASKAIASLFTYTPYAGAAWGGNVPGVGGTHLFKAVWDMYNFNLQLPFPPGFNVYIPLIIK